MTPLCSKLLAGTGLALALQVAATAEPARAVKLVVRTDARTGRLVRNAVVAPRIVRDNVIASRVIVPGEPAPPEAQPAAPPQTFREAIDQMAQKHDLPPALVHSVIRVESNYNPYAISSKGAQGLMQLVPATARRFGVANTFDAVENLEGGVKYLKYLLELYHNDYALALAAYNSGEGAVARHGGVPPYPETVNYLNQVARRLVEAKAVKKDKEKERVQTPPAPPDHNAIREIVEPDGRVRYVSQ
jgi:soluble lytic murein transglycosylase-like protein